MVKFTKDAFKWLSAILIWLSTILGSALPMCIKAPRWTARAESLAGGVFLGAGLAHLLHEAMEKVEGKFDYPVIPAVCLGVFVLLTLIELFTYSEHDADAFGNDHGGHSEIDSMDPLSTSLLSTQSSAGEDEIVLFGSTNVNVTAAMISLYIIMDIHSTIEGLALGIMSTWGGLIAIFCAIIGHKPVEAFALSLIILRDKPTKFLFWIFVGVYTLLSPIGIIISIFISDFTSDTAVGIIGAISAGTFLFVGCHEWSEMFEHKHEWSLCEKTWHFSMFLTGVAWMLLIAIVEAVSPEKD